jgi:hypothetical protein
MGRERTIHAVKLRTTVVLVIGILLGGICLEAVHIVRDKHRNDVFEKRLRCKSLADAYINTNTNDDYVTQLRRVDFSPSHNSCIAMTRRLALKGSDDERFEVVDVISGDVLVRGECSYEDETSKSFCGNGGVDKMWHAFDKLFEKEVASSW